MLTATLIALSFCEIKENQAELIINFRDSGNQSYAMAASRVYGGRELVRRGLESDYTATEFRAIIKSECAEWQRK